MDYTNYLWYGIIVVSIFLFIFILALIITLLRNRNVIIQGTEQYLPQHCNTCGQILEQDWKRCPFCMDIIDKSKGYSQGTTISGNFPIGYLMVKTGSDRGKIYKIENNSITIGSGNQNDIIINDNRVSIQHLKIWFTDRKFYVQDLKSQQGTKVNNRLIDQIELYDNDVIEAVNNVFIFKVLDA